MILKITAAVALILAAIMATACTSSPSTTTTSPATSTTTQPPATTSQPISTPTGAGSLSQYQLEYRLFDRYPDYFWCDPDFYPIAREGQEQENALKQFPDIRANEAEFSAILERIKLVLKNDYTDGEKLDIYREHKKLTRAVQASPAEIGYAYTVRVGEGQGFTIQGEISRTGQIREIGRVSSINTCPICLAEGTLIDTPAGPIPVEALTIGNMVWTLDSSGEKAVAELVLTGSTLVPRDFSVVRVTLADGRTVTASPGHPLPDGRRIGDLRVGDTLDGETVVGTETVPYGERQTRDILPSGPTGFYWANGILVASTLR